MTAEIKILAKYYKKQMGPDIIIASKRLVFNANGEKNGLVCRLYKASLSKTKKHK